MSQLVDTNVLSELARPAPDLGVARWARGVSAILVSVITVEEILFGLSSRPNPRIGQWFDDLVDDLCTVLPITEAVARRAGWLRGQLSRRGQTRTQADMLIAGTAQVHGLTLVTRNDRDFQGCGIPVLNPFSSV